MLCLIKEERAAGGGLVNADVRNGQESRTGGGSLSGGGREGVRAASGVPLLALATEDLSLLFDLGFLVLDRSLPSSQLSRSLVPA